MGQGNDWGLINGQGYILNRDRSHAAASRLNLQFYLWKISLPEAPAIAEVASGTCLWLMDVAQEYPKGQVLGLDYNLRQAPHQAWLPPNAKTQNWNVFEEPPEELVGKFDLVHTRLLVLVVENKDPRPIIRNLMKLLKPGGYLQWDELDTINMTVKKVHQSQSTPALDQLRDWSFADGRHDWTVNLPQFFAEVGLEDAKADFYGDPIHLARAFNEQHLLTADEFAEGLAKLGKQEVASKYFKIVQDAYAESISGAGLCVPRVVCTARKAS
ncbi:hypothetical protein N0V90_001168 [Kalmusia sp. IMI 367209]|nr:hypothetical protein N0V90_001168 [Kalmusia sp. IMI 367209]